MNLSVLARLVLLVSALSIGLLSSAQANGFVSHQSYISALGDKKSLDIEDPASVLAYVLNSSSADIIVQPTENYSYFTFVHNGLKWQGNMRLETEHDVPQSLHFAYFVVPAPWHEEDLGKYKNFGKSDGVSIIMHDKFKYEIAFNGITRTFHLNDIRNIQMPAKMLGPDQIYMGQVNDESGIRFFLVFDKNTLDFSYILDNQKPFLDQLTPFGPENSNLEVGIRSGFVFIDEPSLLRKRLVGVYSQNITRNNYFDGPFDQLPDAFESTMNIKQAFQLIDAEFSEKIDAFGNFTNQDGARVVIAPYLRYTSGADFSEISACGKFLDFTVDYRSCMKDAVGQ